MADRRPRPHQPREARDGRRVGQPDRAAVGEWERGSVHGPRGPLGHRARALAR